MENRRSYVRGTRFQAALCEQAAKSKRTDERNCPEDEQETAPRYLQPRNYATYLSRDELSTTISFIVLSTYFIIKRREATGMPGMSNIKGSRRGASGWVRNLKLFAPLHKISPLPRVTLNSGWLNTTFMNCAPEKWIIMPSGRAKSFYITCQALYNYKAILI